MAVCFGLFWLISFLCAFVFDVGICLLYLSLFSFFIFFICHFLFLFQVLFLMYVFVVLVFFFFCMKNVC